MRKRKKSRATSKGCSITTELNGTLSLRWRSVLDGRCVRRSFPTGLPDTPDHRAKLDSWRPLIGALVRRREDPRPTLAKHFATIRPTPDNAPPPPPTVRSWFREWVPALRDRNVPEHRIAEYEKGLAYVLPLHGDLLLADIADHLDELQHVLLKTPLSAHALKRRRHREGEPISRTTLGVKTVKNAFAAYSVLLGDAVRKKLLPTNPFLGHRFRWEDYETEDDTAEPDPFTDAERTRILEYFRTKQWKARNRRLGTHVSFYGYLFAAFWTGLRPSEIGGLKWGHVDLDAATAKVRERYRGRAFGTKLKTKAARREIELHPTLVGILRELYATRRLKLGRPIEPTDWVFTNTDGQPIRPGAFSEHWYDALGKLGLRTRGLYQTKHTFCSLAVSSSGKLDVFAQLERQTGEPWSTLRKHYARFLPNPVEHRTFFREIDGSLRVSQG